MNTTPIVLSAGTHKKTDQARCLMEAVSEKRKGRKYTDDPPFVPRQLKRLGTLLNDYSTDTERQCLVQFITRLSALKNDLPQELPSVSDICRDYLIRVVLPKWLSLIGLTRKPKFNAHALRSLLEEIDDLRESFDSSELPPSEELEFIGQMVRSTIRPAAEVLTLTHYEEGCVLLTICRTVAEIAWRQGDTMRTAVENVHNELMVELVEVFDLALSEYEDYE